MSRIAGLLFCCSVYFTSLPVAADKTSEPAAPVALEQTFDHDTDTQAGGNAAAASSAGRALSAYYDLVYQIRVISPQAGSKSSIGSGFQVSADGLIITNFHVVSGFVNAPESNRINYRSNTGEEGELELLAFDVINDLAVLRHPDASDEYLALSDQAMQRGQKVYAIGNPRDYGVTLVDGAANGLVKHSYNDQILFSGSLNPGMSGGPAFSTEGQVVGVNVATAGSQLSFLVPVSAVRKLLQKPLNLDAGEYQNEVAAQIRAWQRARIDDLLDSQWPVEEFAEQPLFGEIRRDFQCWGDTNIEDKQRNFEDISKSCQAGNYVYLGGGLNAGQINFSFNKARTLKLEPVQFYNNISPIMGADNNSNYENSGNYQCHVDFVDSTRNEAGYNRVSTCVRAWKKLPQLYDSLLLVERIEADQRFTFHASISAAEPDQIKLLNRKFMELTL